jgi:hypothetical protein
MSLCFALFVNQPIEIYVILPLLDDQIKENKLGEACETRGQEDRTSIGKPQRKRQPARLSRRWMGDITTELEEIRHGA